MRSSQQRLEERERQLVQLEAARAAVAAELQQLQALHGGLERENTALKQQLKELQHAADAAGRAQAQRDQSDRQLAAGKQEAEAARGRAEAELAEARSRLSQAQTEASRLMNELQEARVEVRPLERQWRGSVLCPD